MGVEIYRPEDVEETIALLTRAAQDSRTALTEGLPFYRNHLNPFRVSADRILQGGKRVVLPIPSRGFRTVRSEREYGQKLGIDPMVLIDLATRGDPEAEHIVVDIGCGAGRVVQAGNRATHTSHEKAPGLVGRKIHIVGACDHFYYKISTVLRSLFSNNLKAAIAEAYPGADSNKRNEVEHELSGALAMFLTREEDDKTPSFMNNMDGAVRALRTKDPWNELLEFIDASSIPNIKRILGEGYYSPDTQMKKLLKFFSEHPEDCLDEPKKSLASRPKHHLGILSPDIVLGGDMRDFMETFPENSVSAVMAVRSSVYLLNEDDPKDGIIPFELSVARALKPGGISWQDWPRGNWDSKHYIDEIIAVQRRINTDEELRKNVELYAICGPSDEFPNEYPTIPVALAMFKKPVDKEKWKGALRTHLFHDGTVRDVSYTMLNVNEKVGDLREMQKLIEKSTANDALRRRRNTIADQLAAILKR